MSALDRMKHNRYIDTQGSIINRDTTKNLRNPDFDSCSSKLLIITCYLQTHSISSTSQVPSLWHVIVSLSPFLPYKLSQTYCTEVPWFTLTLVATGILLGNIFRVENTIVGRLFVLHWFTEIEKNYYDSI